MLLATAPALILESGRRQLGNLHLSDVRAHVLERANLATGGVLAIRYQVEVHRHNWRNYTGMLGVPP